MHLRCSNTDCAATLELHDRALSCPVCGDLLEVVVNEVKHSPADLKRLWLERRCSYDPRDAEWRVALSRIPARRLRRNRDHGRRQQSRWWKAGRPRIGRVCAICASSIWDGILRRASRTSA